MRLSHNCLDPPSAPGRQDRHCPNVLPLPMMYAQRFVMLASSSKLGVVGKKGVSLMLYVSAGFGSRFEAECSVVPHANIPFVNG